MTEFGRLLRAFRKRSSVGKISKGNIFTQDDLATQLALIANLDYTVGAISNWEKGKNGINPMERHVIIGLVRTLVFTKGITKLEEAVALLEVGGHQPLTQREIADIRPSWQPADIEEAGLPADLGGVVDAGEPASAEIVGRRQTIHALNNCLTDRSKSCVTVLVGLNGIGKSTVAKQVLRTAASGLRFARTYYLNFETSEQDDVIAFCLDGLNTELANDVPEALGTVLETKKTLVVIDQLPRAAAKALCSFLPILSQQTRYLLLTNGNPQTLNAQIVQLKPLSYRNTVAFVRSQPDLAEFASDKLALLYRAVGGTPQALKLALLLFGQNLLVDDVIDALNDPEEETAEVRALQAQFQAYFGQLDKNTLALLSSFLFASLKGANRETLVAISGIRKTQWRSSFRKLDAQGLILRGTDDNWFAVHNITAHMLLSSLNPLWESGDLALLAERALDRCIQQLDKADRHFLGMDDLRRGWFRTVSTLLSLPSFPTETTDKLLDLCIHIYRYVRRRGFQAEWLPLLRRVVDEVPLPLSAEALQVRNQLGILLMQSGDTLHATDLFDSSHAQAQRLGDKRTVGKTLYHLADTLLESNDVEAAQTTGETAYTYCKDADFALGQAASGNLLGELAMHREDWDSAETYYRESIDLLTKLKQMRESSRAWHNLGLNYLYQNRFAAAAATFESARKLLADPPIDVRLASLTRLRHADALLKLDQHADAAALIETIDRDWLDEQSEAVVLALFYHVQAELYLAKGQLGKARSQIDHALRMVSRDQYPDSVAKSLVLKARIMLARNMTSHKHKKDVQDLLNQARRLTINQLYNVGIRQLRDQIDTLSTEL